jgi:hypothetical protein
VANIASSQPLASFSTPQSRSPWACADAPAGLGSQVFSIGRFEWWPKGLGSTDHQRWTHRPAPDVRSRANPHHLEARQHYSGFLIASTSMKSGDPKL